MKTYHPKTIKEAIRDLQMFLESDMWSKFNPKVVFPAMKNGKEYKLTFYRKDVFKNEKEFEDYLQEHFDIFRKEIRRLRK